MVLEFRVEFVSGTKHSMKLPEVGLGGLVKSWGEITSLFCFFLASLALDLCWVLINGKYL